MPDSSSKHTFPIILFLILLGGTEVMSILTMTGILNIPGVRWDIMPSLCSVLAMLACILPLAADSPHSDQRPTRRRLITWISIGILAIIIANIGLRPWAPSLLYSSAGITIGFAAFTAGYLAIRRRP